MKQVSLMQVPLFRFKGFDPRTFSVVLLKHRLGLQASFLLNGCGSVTGRTHETVAEGFAGPLF
jgi:hypothetical protein